MVRVALACGLLVSTGVFAGEVPVAPEPRPVRGGPSLIVIELVPDEEGRASTACVLRFGIHKGKPLPAETVWEGDNRFVSHLWRQQLVADRYLVTHNAGVIDLDAKKVIHDERGDLYRVEGTKVIYGVANRREAAYYSFDLTTRKVSFEHKRGEGKYGLVGVLSPDGTSAIETGPVADELFLNQPGEKRKSLGKGFHIEIGPLSSTFGPSPVLWLDDKHFLTQRGNGKLVTVDLAGKVTEVVTIKDAPKDLVGAPYLARDGSDRIVYTCGREAYSIDVAKKTWAKYEWHDLGHGFEAHHEDHAVFGRKLRHNGKEIGQFHCWPHTAKTAPGHLAIQAQQGQEQRFQPDCVSVWSAASGDWTSREMWVSSIPGWVK